MGISGLTRLRGSQRGEERMGSTTARRPEPATGHHCSLCSSGTAGRQRRRCSVPARSEGVEKQQKHGGAWNWWRSSGQSVALGPGARQGTRAAVPPAGAS